MSNQTSIFGNRNFILLWLGQTVSKFGDRIFGLSILWYIMDTTGSPFALGISLVCFTLPILIISPIAGICADRNRKKEIIVTTDAINGSAGSSCLTEFPFC